MEIPHIMHAWPIFLAKKNLCSPKILQMIWLFMQSLSEFADCLNNLVVLYFFLGCSSDRWREDSGPGGFGLLWHGHPSG